MPIIVAYLESMSLLQHDHQMKRQDVFTPKEFQKIQEDLCQFLLFAKYVMTPELTSTHGVTWGNENTYLLSIRIKRSSSGPIVKNMGFRKKLYETVLLDYKF